ncbi:Peptidase family M48 [Tranquillimonas rosea]|uniref:Peptidase family M48 n=1 Tax=Tranquillimonas rosea TaxID=641238 RepID=A0A1H9Q0D4_9RHOB|nr:M48 family metallopeptidase [Tranquillimonas rosea]SER53917.1 Peptidase family M48 [Tranquillimonas rosea]
MPCSCHSSLTRRTFLTGAAAVPLATAGCDQAAVLVSEAEAEAMGERAWQQITSDVPATQDAAFSDTVSEVSSRLIRAAGGSPGEWQVVGFDSDRINAFALPGQRIGVFRGLYDVAQNRAQLAAVIGHEIGHLDADHARERMGNARAQNWLQRIIAFVLQTSDVEFGREIMAALGLGLEYGITLPYSRNQELEADALGLRLMAQAGYDPQAAITFWQRMDSAQPGRPPEMIATHPAPESRIREIRDMLPDLQKT